MQRVAYAQCFKMLIIVAITYKVVLCGHVYDMSISGPNGHLTPQKIK